MRYSENVSGADNQQERPFIEAIPVSLGSFLSGFALGEGSFMIVCRKRGDYRRSFKLSAAFNVSSMTVHHWISFERPLGRDAAKGRQRWLVLGGQPPPGSGDQGRAFLRSISDRGAEGRGFSAVEKRSGATLGRRSERPGLPSGSCSPGTDEPWWEETLSDEWNPQRLYAKLRT